MINEIFHLILAYSTIIAIVSAASFSVFALKRFLPGEFYNITKWVTYSYVLLAIYKTIEEVGSLIGGAYTETFHIVEDTLFFAVVLCAIRSAYLFYTFSKVYGFRAKQKR